MDGLEHLRSDPEMAKFLREQDERLARRERNPADNFNNFDNFDTRVRNIMIPVLEQWLRDVILPEINLVDERLNAQLRSLKRKARLRKWDGEAIKRYCDAYADRQPKPPKGTPK
jgi:hypothetical protein